MQFIPYLNFDGNCKEAFAFYAEVFRGEIVMMMTAGSSPMADQFPADARERIIHARLLTSNGVLMGADGPSPRVQPGMCVNISVDEPAEADRVFTALLEGASVQMPIAETFWALRFGMLTDRFGTPWMVNCELPR